MTIFLIIVGAIVLVALIVYISNNKSRKTTTRYNRADEIQKVYGKLDREYDAEMEKTIAKFSHDLWSDTKTNKSDNIEKHGSLFDDCCDFVNNTYANNANNDTWSFLFEWVDLGLPSGTLWKNNNESGFYDYDAAVSSFGSKLPTKEQFEELKESCKWTWTGNGYKVVGPSGKAIFLPAAGSRISSGHHHAAGSNGGYWSSSTFVNAYYAVALDFNSDGVDMCFDSRGIGHSVRLIHD